MVTDSHRDFVITIKILKEIQDILQFTRGMKQDEYLSDLRTQKAVMMTLINIGELCGAYSEAFLKAHNQIPWKQIRAMRNIAAHRYEIINQEDVWETIKTDIPELQDFLENV